MQSQSSSPGLQACQDPGKVMMSCPAEQALKWAPGARWHSSTSSLGYIVEGGRMIELSVPLRRDWSLVAGTLNYSGAFKETS